MNATEEEFLNNTDLFIKDDQTSRLGLLAAKIAYHNFEWRFLTLIMFNSVHAFGLQTFLKNYNKTVIVKLGKFVPKYRKPVPQFVIFAEETSEVSSTFRWLNKVKYDTTAKFVVICGSENQDCDEKKIFQTFLKLYVLNVILLKISTLSNQPQAYSYKIVSPNKCHNGEPLKMDLLADCYNENCFEDLFPEKLSNFYKCPLYVSTVEQPPFMYLHNGVQEPTGTDADLMKLSMDMLNATLYFVTPHDGVDFGHYVNNNWTGSLGDVFNSRVHASMCTTPLTSNKYGNFQISFTYYSMDMVWAAKLPTEQAAWEKLLHPLKIHIRIILLATFIGIIVMDTLKNTNTWRKFLRVFEMRPPKYNFLFYSWIIFLGMPVLKMPSRKYFQIPIYVFIWGCFVLRCGYQAALINSLKHPAYGEKLENFQDVLKFGYPFGGPNSLKDYYFEDRDIYDNWIHVGFDGLYDTLDEILNGTTDFVIAVNKEFIKHHLMKYNGIKQLQILPEKIVNSPTVVYFRKYSPLTNPLNYVLRVAVEGGFVQRINERYLDRDRILHQRFESRRPEPLKWYNFAGCFALLTIGWILSAIYFAVEFICGNLNED